MGAFKNTLVGAGLAGLAAAHARHEKRGTVPTDGTIWTTCVTPGTVALTFDDGPYEYTQGIVDKLTAAGHRATFFQNGQNWDSIYNYNATLQAMIAGGHQVASHTWSHADLATLTADGITSEMMQVQDAHLAIIGKAPRYMRPPYLSTNDLVVSTLKSLDYIIVEVDIDTFDYDEGPVGLIQNSIDWYEGNQTAGGTISLNHDPYQATGETFVPAIIAYLDSKGLKSVPAGECLGDDEANWYRSGAVSSSAAASASASAGPSGSSTYAAPSATPSGNSTVGSGSTPSGSYSYGSGSHTGSWAPGSTASYGKGKGGDTEPGHGPHAGKGALPGHAGEGDDGCTNSTTGGSSYGSGSGSSSGSPPYSAGGSGSSSPKAQPTYYVNSATALSGSAIAIGAALVVCLL